jgi:multidrug efflux pump subunit AcrB
MFEFFYKRPHMLYSIIAAFFVMGLIGLIVMPKNLFPDAERPQVVVISQVPGATPDVVASTVSKPIEQEISTLGLVRDISSVNIAGISVVKAEFEYEKGLNPAAVDVNNALNKIKSKLPPNVNPSIYTAGAFTLPVDIFALSPANESITLGDIRKIVESDIKPALLRNPAIGNAEVFGGYEGAFQVSLDPLKMKIYNVSSDNIVRSLSQFNKNLPIGFVKAGKRFYTLTFYGEQDRVENLKNLYVMPNVRLADIATVTWGYKKRFSGYLGNGKEAIAVAVQRTPGGSVLDTSTAARKTIKALERRYPNIHFEISDTQRDLLQTANRNMLEALRDAIIFTLIVLLFFLGNLKAITAALISIPIVFFSTLAIIWLSGGELNIVVYTAIILALGLLVDDAVVVLENIERHMGELKEKLETAIEKGTKEVIGPVFAGTVATIAIIAPLMFVGDFPQRIFRNLISALIIALLASYFLSITFIPHFSKFLYRKGMKKNRFENLCEGLYQKSLGRFVKPYISVLRFSNGRPSFLRKMMITGPVFLLLMLSIKNIMPVIGKDVMPPMDTGIIKANIKFSANETVDEAINRIQSFTKWLHTRPEVEKSSISFGSEPGVLSLGNGALPTEAVMSIICVDRFSRKKTLWQIEDEIRDQLGRLKNVKSVDVYDFGATPMSSIKAPVDVRVFGEDYRGLPEMGKEINAQLQQIKGLTSTGISWDNDFSEIVLNIDQNKAQYYGISPVQIAGQLALKGFPVSLNANLSTFVVQPVRLYYQGAYGENAETLRLVPIKTPKGFVPLSQLAKMSCSIVSTSMVIGLNVLSPS